MLDQCHATQLNQLANFLCDQSYYEMQVLTPPTRGNDGAITHLMALLFAVGDKNV
jgi:hypothetical protein